jgi:hypothetical protein
MDTTNSPELGGARGSNSGNRRNRSSNQPILANGVLGNRIVALKRQLTIEEFLRLPPAYREVITRLEQSDRVKRVKEAA